MSITVYTVRSSVIGTTLPSSHKKQDEYMKKIMNQNLNMYNQKKDNSLLLSELSHENEDLLSKIDGPEGFKTQIS